MNHQLDDRLRALGTHLDDERAEWDDAVASPYSGRPQRSGSRSRFVLVAASVVLVAGVGGVLATRDRGDNLVAAGAETTAAPAMTAVAPTTVAGPASTVAAPSEAERLAAYSGWYLPTFVPAGYEITSLSAAPAVDSTITTRKWLRTNAAGAVDATFTVSFMSESPQETEKTFVPTPGKTVHGKPALVFDSGEGLRVHWKEAGLMVMAGSTGLSEADLLAGAELFVVVSQSDTPPDNTFPADSPMAGFELVPVDTAVTENGIVLSIGLLSDTGFISVSVTPNSDGTTLGEMLAKDGTATKIGTRDGVLFESAGGNVSVFWLEGGLQFSVSGRAQADDVLALAAGLAPAAPDQILAAGQAITAAQLALPEIDAATLTDGTRVSVRGTAATGAVAICVTGASPQCVRQVSESSLDGERPSAIFQMFVLGDERALIGWHEGTELPTSTGVETVAGTSGVFVRAAVTDLNNPPQVTFDNGGQPVIYGTSSGWDRLIVSF